jgi:hypothetical protein
MMAQLTHIIGLCISIGLLMAWQSRTVITLGGKQASPSMFHGVSWWVIGCFFSLQAVWLEWFQPTGQFVWLGCTMLLWHVLLSWGESLRDEQRRRPPVRISGTSSLLLWQYHLEHTILKHIIPFSVSVLIVLQTWVAGGWGLTLGLAYLLAQMQFLYGWHPLMAQTALMRTLFWLTCTFAVCITLGWLSLQAWWLQTLEWSRHLLALDQLWLNPIATLKLLGAWLMSTLRDPFPWTGFVFIVLLDMIEKQGGFSLGGVRQTRQRPGMWLLQQDFASHPPMWLLLLLVFMSFLWMASPVQSSHVSTLTEGFTGLYPSVALWVPILLPRLVALLEDWVLTAPQDHRKDLLFWVHRVFPFGLVIGALVGLMAIAQGLPAVMQPGVHELEAWLHTLALPSTLVTMFQVLDTAAFWKLPLYGVCVWMLLGGSFLWLLQQEVSRRQWLKGLICWCLSFWLLMAWAIIPILGRYGDTPTWQTSQNPLVSPSRQGTSVWMVLPYQKDLSMIWLAQTPIHNLPRLHEMLTEEAWLQYKAQPQGALVLSSQNDTLPTNSALQRPKQPFTASQSQAQPQSIWLALSDAEYFSWPHYQRRQWQLIQTMAIPRRPFWVSMTLGLTPTASLYQDGGMRWLQTDLSPASQATSEATPHTTKLTPLSDAVLEQVHIFQYKPMPWY